MNIFYLDTDPKVAAMYHNDKHVVKMIVEYAQLLSTAHRVLDGELYIDQSSKRKIKRYRMNTKYFEDTLYKATHINHPSAVWVRESSANYEWLYKLFIQLCFEYTIRYGKTHATFEKLSSILSKSPINIKQGPMTEIPQAMPDHCKCDNPVDGYRTYYILEKSKFNTWKTQKPNWI